MSKDTITIDDVEYVSMAIAAETVRLTPAVFGTKLPCLESNGVRVYRTCKNNKGTKVCRADLESIMDIAIETGLPITEITIRGKKL